MDGKHNPFTAIFELIAFQHITSSDCTVYQIIKILFQVVLTQLGPIIQNSIQVNGICQIVPQNSAEPFIKLCFGI